MNNSENLITNHERLNEYLPIDPIMADRGPSLTFVFFFVCLIILQSIKCNNVYDISNRGL